MNEFARELPFFSQKKGPLSWTCGAASLQMIYSTFGIHVDHDSIWASISAPRADGKQRFSHTFLMVKDAMNKGLLCSCIAAYPCESFFDYCAGNHIELIMLYHQKRTDTTGHYSVVCNRYGGSIYVNNPYYDEQYGKGQRIRLSQVPTLMMRQREHTDEIGMDYTFLAFQQMPPSTDLVSIPCNNPSCSNASIQTSKCISVIADKILCSDCNYFMPNPYNM